MKIIAAAAAFLLATGSAYAQSVSVRNLTPPGVFEVVNEGGEVSLSSRVQVQVLDNGAWQNLYPDIHSDYSGVHLVRDCRPPPIPDCIMLHVGEHLRPPPWPGDGGCGSQCFPGVCRASSPPRPGTFRFVVKLCSGDKSFAGPAFYKGVPPSNVRHP